jgi:hypothetical protein
MTDQAGGAAPRPAADYGTEETAADTTATGTPKEG